METTVRAFVLTYFISSLNAGQLTFDAKLSFTARWAVHLSFNRPGAWEWQPHQLHTFTYSKELSE